MESEVKSSRILLKFLQPAQEELKQKLDFYAEDLADFFKELRPV